MQHNCIENSLHILYVLSLDGSFSWFSFFLVVRTQSRQLNIQLQLSSNKLEAYKRSICNIRL